MIKDQQTMCGTGKRTVAEVEAWWRSVSRRPGWTHWVARPAEKARDPELIVRDDVELEAYVNHGRWVANCLCGGGIAAWSENPRGACLDCGTVYRVRFPAEDVALAVEILSHRPAANRNWRPRDGEPLALLALENAENGLPVPERVRDLAEAAGLATIVTARAREGRLVPESLRELVAEEE